MLSKGILLFLLSHRAVAASPDATCDSSTTASSFLPSVTCSREHVSQSLSALAPCKPRDKVLKVPWPSNSSYSQLTPSHVVVRRCSGGCHGGLTSCVPTKTDKRKVSVLLARCPLGGGSCQKECATLEVEDELACGCGCRLDPSSCRPEDQEWREETCNCQCKDKAAITSCLQGGRAWDHQTCRCLCPPSDPCPEDHNQDPVTCSCGPATTKRGEGGKAGEGAGGERVAHQLGAPCYTDTGLLERSLHRHHCPPGAKKQKNQQETKGAPKPPQ